MLIHNTLFLGSLTVICAAIIQTLTGFGFGVVSVPFLLLLFPSQEAILLSMILSLCSLCLQFIPSRRSADWHIVWYLIVIGLPGLILGVVSGGKMNPIFLKGIIGFTLVAYVIIQWLQSERDNLKTTNPETTAATASPIPLEKNSQASDTRSSGSNIKPYGLAVAGFFSGLLTGVVGLPGPPVVAVLIRYLPKEKFRATIVSYFVIEYVLAISIFLILRNGNSLNSTVATTVLILIIPTVAGFFIGRPIRRFIVESNFKRLVFMLLLIVGFTSIGDFVKTLWH